MYYNTLLGYCPAGHDVVNENVVYNKTQMTDDIAHG
jgi:hypothetical protein